VPGEIELCRVVALMGVLPDTVGVLRRAGPPSRLASPFCACGRTMGGVHVVEGRVGFHFSGARGTLSVVQRLLQCGGVSVSLTPL
jgi:hypothetical protein